VYQGRRTVNLFANPRATRKLRIPGRFTVGASTEFSARSATRAGGNEDSGQHGKDEGGNVAFSDSGRHDSYSQGEIKRFNLLALQLPFLTKSRNPHMDYKAVLKQLSSIQWATLSEY
jgi:hypothetical protein